MKKLILAVFCLLPALVSADVPKVDPGKVVIGRDPAKITSLSLPKGMGIAAFHRNRGIHVLSFKESKGAVPFTSQIAADIADTCATLKAENPDIRYCEPRYEMHAFVTPNDPSYSDLWGMEAASLPEAWDKSHGSAAVKVGVVDTGVDYNHPDLAANVVKADGYDFANNDSNPMDDNGHGTHVSGTIGAAGNNGVGVVGINWRVTIIPVKVLDSEGSGYTDAIASGINHAVTKGAKVINLSLGGPGFSQDMYDAIENAKNHGVLVACAAGNESEDNDYTPSYPASYDLDNIISVAATDENDDMAYFSNYGATSVHLGAPGVGILSTVPSASYDTYDGTSMASPHVAGVAALIWGYNSSLTMAQVRSAILNSVDPVSSLNGYTTTGGRLNARAALDAAGSSNPPAEPTPKPTATPTPPGYIDPTNPGDPVLYLGYKTDKRRKTVTLKSELWDAATEDFEAIAGAKVGFYCKGKSIGKKVTNSSGIASMRISAPKKTVTCEVHYRTVVSNRVKVKGVRR